MNAGPFAALADDTSVFRAMSYESMVQSGRVHFRAFRLRAANDKYPEEDSISVGTSPAGAKAGLTGKTFGVAELSVQEVHNLPYGLQIRETEEPEKGAIFGIPLPSDVAQAGLALTIAKDLAALANMRALILD
jgi:hypothetical protein